MEVKLEDLIVKCMNCEGSGQLENPLLNKNRSGYDSHIISATPVDCNKCNGRGLILTQSGKTLIEFFQIAKDKRFIY